MKLFNAISNQWFEATEYTEKAWREGRRDFLFDYGPTNKKRRGVVNSMDGAVYLENDMYSNIDVAEILKSTLGDLGVVEGEDSELEFKYEK